MTPLYPELVELLSADPWARRAAVGRCDVGQSAVRFALRRVLWQDADATVRAAAALQLGRCKASAAASAAVAVTFPAPPSAPVKAAAWLGDACGDVAPLVREAALRGLARLSSRLPVLSRAEQAKRAAVLSASDPVWWVRRAALLAYSALLSLHAERTIPLLRARLGDPFWRVRHAAAQALYAIGLRQPQLRDVILAPSAELPGPAQAGLWYLRARFAPSIDVHAFPVPSFDGPLHNADPAVTTARLRAQNESDPASESDPLKCFRHRGGEAHLALPNEGDLERSPLNDPLLLVPFFADPHEPLRRLADVRLRRYIARCEKQGPGYGRSEREIQAVLQAVVPWLETPTQPHAAETACAFLDSLGEPSHHLCREILHQVEPAPGALSWAAAYAAQTESHDLLPALLRHCEHPQAQARAAVLAALLSLPPLVQPGEAENAVAESGSDARQRAWARGLADESSEVRSLAVLGLSQSRDAALHALLWQRPLSDFLPAARLAVVDLARRSQRYDLLLRAASDPHPLVRAQALHGLAKSAEKDLKLSAPSARLPVFAEVLRDRDPELRLAALSACPGQWLSLLADDPDPLVRRQALRALASKQGRQLGAAVLAQAGLLASQSSDPWLRTEAAALLDAADEAALRVLLALSRDSEESVRAAAADALHDPAIAPRLRQLLSPRSLTTAEVHAVDSPALTDEQRAAAYAWIALHEGTAASELLTAASHSADEPALVRELLPSLRYLVGDVGEDFVAAAERSAATPASAAGSSISPAVTSAPAPRRVLGRTGIAVSPLGLSGAYEPPLSAMQRARQAGVNLFFWEPSYLKLTRFLRRHNQQDVSARKDVVIVAGSFEADRFGIERDVARALRRLRTTYLDVLLLLWVRSPERLSQEALSCLRDLKRRGTIRAFGFSTHHRDLAETAAASGDWDVLMLRHSAAHPGAEDRLLPLCQQHGVGVITFSALSYGRLLRSQPMASPIADDGQVAATGDIDREPAKAVARRDDLGPLPTALDCYRYTLSQPGVSACWSAPRSYSELSENLAVLPASALSVADCERLRRHGQLVRAEDRRFSTFLRRGHDSSAATLARLSPPNLSSNVSPTAVMPVGDLHAPPPLSIESYESSEAGAAQDALNDFLQLLDEPSPWRETDPTASATKTSSESAEATADSRPSSHGDAFALALGQSFLSRRRKSEKM